MAKKSMQSSSRTVMNLPASNFRTKVSKWTQRWYNNKWWSKWFKNASSTRKSKRWASKYLTAKSPNRWQALTPTTWLRSLRNRSAFSRQLSSTTFSSTPASMALLPNKWQKLRANGKRLRKKWWRTSSTPSSKTLSPVLFKLTSSIASNLTKKMQWPTPSTS